MVDITPNTTSFELEVGPINESAQNAAKAETWAEGTDAQVSALGGTHSAKGWAEVAEEMVGSIGQVMHYKGSVSNYAALQAITGQELADVYNVLDTGNNYAWTGSDWDQLSGAVDLSAYRTAAAQDVIDAKKLENIATGNNSLTILGTPSAYIGTINIGPSSVVTGASAVAIGCNSSCNNSTGGIAIGYSSASNHYRTIALGYASVASGESSVAIGQSAQASAGYAIQLGKGTNSSANTLYVGLDASHNYLLLDASGNIPSARLANALPSQTGNSGKFLTTDGTSVSWATVQAGGAPTLTWYTGNTGTAVTIGSTASSDLVKVYKNGILLQPTADYTITYPVLPDNPEGGDTLTLTTALVSTDKIAVEVF